MPHIHEKIDFTVEVFIVHKNKILLRLHEKYKAWLSVGGHIELDEDPVEAAIREVQEEVGLKIKLYDGNMLLKDAGNDNKQLIPPIALCRHSTTPTHEHVTFMYFATSDTDQVIPEKPDDQWKWVEMRDLDSMDLRPDILFYSKEALRRLS